MKMTLIDNCEYKHADVLNPLISEADTLFIAVAFLKSSGLQLLSDSITEAVKKGCKATIIVGQDYCITEPTAIKNLHNLLKGKKHCSFYFMREGNHSYHPKLYLCMKSNSAWLITGSANFTKGGMSENVELSLMLDTTRVAPICKSAINWFDSISKDKNAIKVDDLSINQYEARYKIYTRINKKARNEIQDELSNINVLDLSKIAKYLDEYNSDSAAQEDVKEKKLNYIKAKGILNKLISERVKSKKDFVDNFGKLIGKSDLKGLWHSGGLARGRTTFERKYNGIIALIKLLKAQLHAEPDEVYNIGYEKIKKIERFGVNKLTEILNTYKPEKFSVLNGLSVKAMKHLGFNIKSSAQSFTGKDYTSFNSILTQLNEHCRFKDLSQVDHFLNYIYWKHVKL